MIDLQYDEKTSNFIYKGYIIYPWVQYGEQLWCLTTSLDNDEDFLTLEYAIRRVEELIDEKENEND